MLTSIPFCFSFNEFPEPLSEGLSQRMVARSSNTSSALGRRGGTAPRVLPNFTWEIWGKAGNLIQVLSSSACGN